MRKEFRDIRIKQLSRTLQPFETMLKVVAPRRGWLRAIREACGLSLGDVGRKLHGTRQLASHFENAEASERITLQNLKKAADALGCKLVYAVVPKTGRLEDLVITDARARVRPDIMAVQHSMALENQAILNVEEKIEQHAQRPRKGRR